LLSLLLLGSILKKEKNFGDNLGGNFEANRVKISVENLNLVKLAQIEISGFDKIPLGDDSEMVVFGYGTV